MYMLPAVMCPWTDLKVLKQTDDSVAAGHLLSIAVSVPAL